MVAAALTLRPIVRPARRLTFGRYAIPPQEWRPVMEVMFRRGPRFPVLPGTTQRPVKNLHKFHLLLTSDVNWTDLEGVRLGVYKSTWLFREFEVISAECLLRQSGWVKKHKRENIRQWLLGKGQT